MKYILIFLLFTTSLSAQVKGQVVDANNQPIPYVNVFVQNETIGTSTNEDGSFFLPINQEKQLIFTALGYEKKIIKSSEASLVKLIATSYQLNEVVVLNKKETKTVEVGQTKNTIAQAFENGPKLDARFFPYDAKVKKNRYLKKVSIFTESNIDDAIVKIHFYELDVNGLPGQELLDKDVIVHIKKGSRRSYFDVSSRNIVFPKTGLFVAVERLLIDKNKFTKTVTALDSDKTKTQITYYPLLFYNLIERDFTFTYYGGLWHKEFKKSNDTSIKTRVFEPAINLILTN